MKSLRNCPFCGGKAQFSDGGKERFDALVKEYGSACLLIECTDCGARMFIHHDVMDYDEMVDIGIRKWNRRTVCQRVSCKPKKSALSPVRR